MQFDMSAPKIFPICFHHDAKRKHKSLRKWIMGSRDHGTAPHLCISPVAKVVGQSCSVQLPSPSAGPGWWELPCSVRNFKESPSTGKLQGQGHSKENSPTARAVGASTTCPHLTTCTDQSHHQGLRADLTQDSTQCPHPTRHRGRTAVQPPGIPHHEFSLAQCLPFHKSCFS